MRRSSLEIDIPKLNPKLEASQGYYKYEVTFDSVIKKIHKENTKKNQVKHEIPKYCKNAIYQCYLQILLKCLLKGADITHYQME